MESLANLHKRLKALARYYVTSYWQAEWVNKLRWKTTELLIPPPPPPPDPTAYRHRNTEIVLTNFFQSLKRVSQDRRELEPNFTYFVLTWTDSK